MIFNSVNTLFGCRRGWVWFLALTGVVVLGSGCGTSSGGRYKDRYSSVNKRERTETKTSRPSGSSGSVYAGSSDKKSANTSAVTAVPGSMRARITESATAYAGTNYRYGGKSPDTGFDCSGFTGYVFSKNGIPLSGPSDVLAKKGKPKSRDQLAAGDLVFFGDKGRISHVGIVTANRQDGLTIVHATTSSGVRVDNISGSEYWEKKFLFGRDVLNE